MQIPAFLECMLEFCILNSEERSIGCRSTNLSYLIFIYHIFFSFLSFIPFPFFNQPFCLVSCNIRPILQFSTLSIFSLLGPRGREPTIFECGVNTFDFTLFQHW
ncbi:hypothetical protein ABZP36_035586 [Zizania latifolia]